MLKLRPPESKKAELGVADTLRILLVIHFPNPSPILILADWKTHS